MPHSQAGVAQPGERRTGGYTTFCMASSELLHDFEAKPVLHNLASGGHAVIPLFDMAIAELLHEITAEPVLHNLASTSKPVLHKLFSGGLAVTPLLACPAFMTGFVGALTSRRSPSFAAWGC